MSGVGETVTLRVRKASMDDVHQDLARLHRDHRPGIRAGDVIVLHVGRRTARAVARGPQGMGSGLGQISLDLRLREHLGVRPGEDAAFRINKGSTVDTVLWAWHATDAMTRMMARLAVVSVVLGFVGLCLGVLSLVT